MFKSARLKLTAWYLAIIMLVTLSFSAVVILGVERNTRHALEGQRLRIERRFDLGNGRIIELPRGVRMLDTETLLEIRNQTFYHLLLINLAVLVGAGSLGYILAGRTLRPIEMMVEKQKRFISDAAHEMKTPLTAMKTTLEVNLRNSKLTPEDAKDTIKDTVEEVDKLTNLVNSLLNQSRYQNGLYTLADHVDLELLLHQVTKKYASHFNNQQVSIELKTKPATVLGNKEALEELVTNLIDNAVKYGKSHKPIKVSLKTEKAVVKIIVQDFGQGIAKEDLDCIFEPFFRADKSRTNSDQQGFGLGLAIVKEIVDRHNGMIEVDSKKDKGTKFTVSFPTKN